LTIVFYTSGHGFGHASRDLEIINAIGDRDPQARILVRTTVPSWFLEISRRVPVERHPVETDPGVVQAGSLAIDEHQTALAAFVFYSAFPSRVHREVELLRRLGATLVVGDIPPLAFAAAAAAGLPSIALGNFTWDWIYRAYPRFEETAPGVISQIGEAYAAAGRVLRLPFHGGFESVQAPIEDLPLVARRAGRGRDDTRRLLHLGREELVVLASFGGHQVVLPMSDLGQQKRFTLLVTDHEVPDQPHDTHPSVRWFRRADLTARGVRYEDLVAAADVVVAKLGYGIVSECIANDTALLYTSRGRFPEQEVFMAELPRVLRCRVINQDDLREGRWVEGVDAVVAQPSPPAQMNADGAERAADAILDVSGRFSP
jgi:L-arabinokinase